jgi:hypothetical protein
VEKIGCRADVFFGMDDFGAPKGGGGEQFVKQLLHKQRGRAEAEGDLYMNSLWGSFLSAMTGISPNTNIQQHLHDDDDVTWGDEVDTLSNEFTATVQLSDNGDFRVRRKIDEEVSMLGLDLSASDSECEEDLFMGPVCNRSVESALHLQADSIESRYLEYAQDSNLMNLWTLQSHDEDEQCLFAGRVRTSEKRSIRRQILKRRGTICLGEHVPSADYFDLIRVKAVANLSHHLDRIEDRVESVRTIQSLLQSTFISISLRSQLSSIKLVQVSVSSFAPI